MEDVYIVTAAQLCCYLLLSRSLVADQTNDDVLWVFRDLLDELELGCRLARELCGNTTHGRLTPIPLDAPVITYTDMLADFT